MHPVAVHALLGCLVIILVVATCGLAAVSGSYTEEFTREERDNARRHLDHPGRWRSRMIALQTRARLCALASAVCALLLFCLGVLVGSL